MSINVGGGEEDSCEEAEEDGSLSDGEIEAPLSEPYRSIHSGLASVAQALEALDGGRQRDAAAWLELAVDALTAARVICAEDRRA